ncbi:hypothetical protein WH221_07265 [Chryseobacterium culicis]|uniref:HTTM domain-containing protein n=1 Tax=Chryseobacterium culicis TaxID=680127 RepID=A0A2S9CZU0_CHRCI|nr:hypothetical protein [Chryseobacterium culicis]PRB86038.1 hypothetical protein CQ022_07245 [Chryseobacterium culicis]PRB91791.1 hypothetical protein CQ033_00915 [Chryseobacterium culicis]
MDRIYTFFFTQQNNNFWLTFFRIAISLLIIIHFVSILPDFKNLYSVNEGVIGYNVTDIFVPDYLINLPKIIIFFDTIGIAPDTTILSFKILFLAALGTLLLGYKQNLSALIVLFLQIALVKTNSYYAYGVDFFTSMSLFYLAIIPRDLSSLALSPFKRLFQIHVSIVYFFAGFDKIIGTNWWNGENIWKAINLPFATNTYDITFLGHFPILLTVFGLLTVILELTYPFFVWQPKISKYWIYLTILMHVGIAFILNLYFFSSIMIIWNLTLLFSFNNEKPTQS